MEDEEFAAETLTNINYFRLAHYFSLYLQEDGKYKEGTKFKEVLRVYDFDRKLRSLLMGALEELEELGIQDGDTVRMYGLRFDYYK